MDKLRKLSIALSLISVVVVIVGTLAGIGFLIYLIIAGTEASGGALGDLISRAINK